MKYIYKQYLDDKKYLIKHNYLKDQFSDYKKILKKISRVVKFGDFTLGKEVEVFEKNFKKIQKSKYAIGVGSGTDAIMLSLIALGIKKGDEVITSHLHFTQLSVLLLLQELNQFLQILLKILILTQKK